MDHALSAKIAKYMSLENLYEYDMLSTCSSITISSKRYHDICDQA